MLLADKQELLVFKTMLLESDLGSSLMGLL